MSVAVSPDARYVVTVNAGFETFESQYLQSLAVLDTQTGALTDFPDQRTLARTSEQTLYSGLSSPAPTTSMRIAASESSSASTLRAALTARPL